MKNRVLQIHGHHSLWSKFYNQGRVLWIDNIQDLSYNHHEELKWRRVEIFSLSCKNVIRQLVHFVVSVGIQGHRGLHVGTTTTSPLQGRCPRRGSCSGTETSSCGVTYIALLIHVLLAFSWCYEYSVLLRICCFRFESMSAQLLQPVIQAVSMTGR